MIYLDCKVCFPEPEQGTVPSHGIQLNPLIHSGNYHIPSFNYTSVVSSHLSNYCNPPPVSEPSTTVLLVLGFVAIILYKEINARIFSRRN